MLNGWKQAQIKIRKPAIRNSEHVVMKQSLKHEKFPDF